jgi:hypothetical protein
VALLIGTISVAGAIFLVLELNHPCSGWIRLADAPIRSALASMDRQVRRAGFSWAATLIPLLVLPASVSPAGAHR